MSLRSTAFISNKFRFGGYLTKHKDKYLLRCGVIVFITVGQYLQ